MSTTRPLRTNGKRKAVKTTAADAPAPLQAPVAPQVIVWHRSAPRRIARAGFWGHESLGWRAWMRHLTRREDRNLGRLFPRRKGSPLSWVRSNDDSWGATLALVEGLVENPRRGQRSRQEADAEVRAWMLESDPQGAPAAYAMECLAWAYALPQLSRRLSAEAWWELLDCLLSAIHVASEPAVEKDTPARLLLAGELPLVLAYQLPELRTPRRLRDAAQRTISSVLLSVTEPSGWWLAAHTPNIFALAASWLRCRPLARELKRSWDEPAERRFQDLLTHLVRFARPDGTLPLVEGTGDAATPALAVALLDAMQADAGRRAAACSLAKLLPSKHRTTASSSKAVSSRKAAAAHSEEAGLALLRTDWRPAADRVSVDFAGAMPELEVAVGNRVLVRGPWDVAVQLDGRPAHLAGPWEVLCWHCDKDVDYLELEADYEDDLVVGRHILLAKRDRWLLLADSVIGQRGERIDYRGDLQMAEGVTFLPQVETSEGQLDCRQRSALVLPLALPEWRSDRRFGQLHSDQRRLTLEQQGTGRSLFAPLLIDLDAKRANSQRTWRQLTVAQDRNILPGHTAAAFRVQIAAEQWLFYRSLTGRANRTVLGHNLVTEFLAARFTQGGTTKQLLEIA